MQFHQFQRKGKDLIVFAIAILCFHVDLFAQVNTVEFGKNRVQFRKFKWQYYQTPNFNTYFYENGQTIANYVTQIAEEELPGIEQFVEYGLQRRINIVIYNHFNELEQSNIGLNLDWQTTGGITKLVNNKMIVYFNGDHEHLRRQIRSGLAKVLVDNILFGDDLGEFATNQALLDLPKWLVDGYVDYVAEDWSTTLDDQLKSAILSGSYKNFYQFAYDKPLLAGHGFWNYIAEKHKKENVTYFLYLARVYRNLNSASNRITKKKFKDLVKDFMADTEEKYTADIRGRRDIPKGTVTVVEEVSKNRDFIRFTPQPAARSSTYAVVEYIKGQYCVVLYVNGYDRKVLLKTGVRVNDNEVNPNYPLLAWDPKGTLLTCIYWAEGQTRLFTYDVVKNYKPIKNQVLDQFEQIQDMKYMLDNNTLLMSAVRKGQSDIFVYKIDKNNFEQITNDSYADLDPSFVAFPGKTGILFSSNRPNGLIRGGDTAVPVNRYNVFLIDNWNRSDFKQISQLTNMKYGTARYPMQYNTTHFTFISDDFGVANRFAGFFRTRKEGLDTVYLVADQILRNPDMRELDSTLQVYGKSKPDSIFSFQVSNDSAYVFPISNYQSALLETKIAGLQGLMSETRQQGDLKFLYKLKVDDAALRKRNINPKPTDYRKRTITAEIMSGGKAIQFETPAQDTARSRNAFETEFDNDGKDSTRPVDPVAQAPLEPETQSVLKRAKLFDYKLKFSADNFSGSFNNDILINRYEPFTGSLPVVLQSGGAFNGMLKASVFDLFEDIRFTGAIRLPLISGLGTGAAIGGGTGGGSIFVPVNSSLFDGGGEWFARADYLKKRLDYSVVYYRKTEIGGVAGVDGTSQQFEAKQYSNLYQGVIRYPFDRVRSLRLSAGIRNDRVVVRGTNFNSSTLKSPTLAKQTFAVNRLEYVYDNTIMKATNIWNGLRYKVYADLNAQISKPSDSLLKPGRMNFNIGTDIRYYHQIFRNFIWAGRAAADFSWGNQKILYYLGGIDGWMFPKYSRDPQPTQNDYAYQSLAVNMRGFNQNVANGNNAMVLNSEFRFPVFATLFNKPINNAFLRNFQLTQFIDLGTAWSGPVKNIARPSVVYPNDDGTAIVKLKAGGVGPLVGGYGFGARSTLLGYFLKLDCAWEMNGFFRGKPLLYFGMGVDF